MKKNDMNLLDRYRDEQKRKSQQSSPGKTYLVILVVSLLLVGAFVTKMLLDNLSLENRINELKSYVDNSATAQKLAEVKETQDNIQRLDAIDKQIRSLNDVLAYKPRFDTWILDIIHYEKPSDIKFSKIKYEENTVILDMYGPRSSDASNYVLRLQRTMSFADVSYSGYSYDEANKVYRAQIICIMKGGY